MLVSYFPAACRFAALKMILLHCAISPKTLAVTSGKPIYRSLHRFAAAAAPLGVEFKSTRSGAALTYENKIRFWSGAERQEWLSESCRCRSAVCHSACRQVQAA